MLKRIPVILISTILFLVLVGPAPAFSGVQVLVLLSAHVKPYEEALSGFRLACYCTTRKIVLSGTGPYFDLSQEIEATAPDLVLAVGREALVQLKNIRDMNKTQDIPIVYMMTLNPEPLTSDWENVPGVRMTNSPYRQLTSFLRAAPRVQRIGLLYHPAKSEKFVEGAVAAAAHAGVELIIKETQRPEDIPGLIDEMAGMIDAFWMIPDASIVMPESTEAILLFSVKNMVPVLTFSDKYLEFGALMSMSVSINAVDMGRQTGRMVERILDGTDIALINDAYAEDGVLTINELVAKNLNIYIAYDLPEHKQEMNPVKGE